MLVNYQIPKLSEEYPQLRKKSYLCFTKTKKMKITKENIVKYSLESLIEAFGVFLGLVVSDWNSQRKINKQVDRSLTYIIEELQTNVNTLDKAIDYHIKIALEFDSAVSRLDREDYFVNYYASEGFKFNTLPSWSGPGMALLEKSAFESAKIGGVFQELDVSSLQLISKMYSQQETYSMYGKAVFDKLTGINSESKTFDVILILSVMSNDLLNSEKGLKIYLEQNIEKLKATTNKVAFNK